MNQENKNKELSRFFFNNIAFLFYALCLSFVFLLLIDTFNPGFVSDYFSLNLFKYICLGVGLVWVFKNVNKIVK